MFKGLTAVLVVVYGVVVMLCRAASRAPNFSRGVHLAQRRRISGRYSPVVARTGLGRPQLLASLSRGAIDKKMWLDAWWGGVWGGV